MGGIGEFNIILALGVLLAVGFVGVWLVRLLHLDELLAQLCKPYYSVASGTPMLVTVREEK